MGLCNTQACLQQIWTIYPQELYLTISTLTKTTQISLKLHKYYLWQKNLKLHWYVAFKEVLLLFWQVTFELIIWPMKVLWREAATLKWSGMVEDTQLVLKKEVLSFQIHSKALQPTPHSPNSGKRNSNNFVRWHWWRKSYFNCLCSLSSFCFTASPPLKGSIERRQLSWSWKRTQGGSRRLQSRLQLAILRRWSAGRWTPRKSRGLQETTFSNRFANIFPMLSNVLTTKHSLLQISSRTFWLVSMIRHRWWVVTKYGRQTSHTSFMEKPSPSTPTLRLDPL